MWDIEKHPDGRFVSGIEDNVWTAPLPFGSFAEARASRREPTLRAKRVGDAVSVTLDSEHHGDYPDMMAAHREGYRLARERHLALVEDAYASTGLSADRWEFKNRYFVGRENRGEMILLTNFGAMVGSVRLGSHDDALAAEAAIDAVPHLSDRLLDDLERAYSGGFDGHHPTHYAALEDAGYVERCDGERVVLTDSGRATLDSDPRVLPVAMRDAIFEAAASLSEARATRGSADEAMTSEDARRRFNDHFHRRGDNVAGMRMLLEHPDLDLSVDTADTEPHEIVLVANGRLSEGRSVRGCTVLLLSPNWVEDDSELLAEAVIECRDELVSIADRGVGIAPRP